VIYFILAAVIIALGIYAWIAGNFANLTTAYDPNGKGCGVAYKNYPYIYFASPHTNVNLASFSHSGSPSAYPSAQLLLIRFYTASPTVWLLPAPPNRTPESTAQQSKYTTPMSVLIY